MPFKFSIRTAIKDSWNMYVKHIWFFMSLAFVMIIFSLFYNTHRGHSVTNTVLLVIVFIAMVMWSYVSISASLAAVDKKDKLLSFRSLSAHMPTITQFAVLVVIGVTVGLTVAIGFVLLVIPGVYFLTRLAFANTAFVDHQNSIGKSLSYSWHLVKGKIFWTVFLMLIIEIVLVIIGSVTIVGSLVTYPLAMLLMTYLYRALTVHQYQLEHHTEVTPATAVVVE